MGLIICGQVQHPSIGADANGAWNYGPCTIFVAAESSQPALPPTLPASAFFFSLLYLTVFISLHLLSSILISHITCCPPRVLVRTVRLKVFTLFQKDKHSPHPVLVCVMTIFRRGGVISVCVCVCMLQSYYADCRSSTWQRRASTSAFWDRVNEDKGVGGGQERSIPPPHPTPNLTQKPKITTYLT